MSKGDKAISSPSGANTPGFDFGFEQEDTPPLWSYVANSDKWRGGVDSSHLSPAKATPVYDTLWYLATERQNIFFRKVHSESPPFTKDPILAQYKFTNAYRASDRVSQYLIANVQYDGPQDPKNILYRTLLFKFFNRVSTWELIQEALGEVRWSNHSFDCIDKALTRAQERGKAIYSGAYIMPSAKHAFGHSKKHRNHLELLETILMSGLASELSQMESLKALFKRLRSFPSLGDFLAFQFTIDLNYSSVITFDESEFVIPGPGARDGIRKCFSDLGGLSEAQIIEEVTNQQEKEFELRGLPFQTLWGRRLQLVDVQNLFCEVSKYARRAHPEAKGVDGRTQIKQKYTPTAKPLPYFYPPKWGINDRVNSQRLEITNDE